ncbi:MAG: dihydroorotase [Daejeonella sp.]
MEKILIQSVTILDQQSKYHEKVRDILIVDGKIQEISTKITGSDIHCKTINGKGQYVCPGFFDLNTNFGEPGLETKEDLQSGCKAAAAGGFTGVALMPNTQPPIHSKGEVSYIINKTKNNLVDVYPLACITEKREGKELAEMYDMQQAGALAFTDGNKPVSNAELMSRAMLYTKGFDGLIFSYAEDANIAGKGKMNEGVMSTLLGMKGNPALAEELMVARDIYLAEYNDANIHFSTVSTAKSVDLIKQARKNGLKITCDVAAYHLVLSENELEGFDSQYKVKPPLRTQADIKALISGLKAGIIDAIVSQHTPHEIECKNVEFELAAYGMLGLQTVLPMAIAVGLIPQEIANKLSINPRKIVGLSVPTISENKKANLVVFNPEAEWVYNENTNFSKSSNSPFMNKTLKGKVTLVYNNSQYFIS